MNAARDDLSSIRVLIVEDVDADVRLIQEELGDARATDIVTESVRTLAEGVSRLAQGGIDVVLLDLGLPDSQGLDTLTGISRGSPDTPIVVITGFDDEARALEAARTGAEDYILKGTLDGRSLARSLRYAAERRRLESRLRESEKHHRALFEHSGAAMAIIGPDAIVKQVNRRAEELLEVSRHEVVGNKRWFEFISAEDSPRLIDLYKRRRQLTFPAETEIPLVLPSGHDRFVRINAVLLPDNDDIVVSLEDMTERRKVESELRHQREHFHSLFANAPEGIVFFDGAGRVMDANPEFERMFGFKFEEMAGRPILDFILPSRLSDEGTETLRSALAGGTYVPKTRRRRADGTEIVVSILGAPIFLEGQASGGFGIYRDMTAFFEAQDRLQDSFIDLVETTSRAMESVDPYTAGHQRRVGRLADLVGRKMGLDEDRLQGIYVGSLLHDIGKLSLPSTILTKPTALSQYEWNLIRSHPRRGYEILADANLPWPVADMALKHHERQDGSGYPNGESAESLGLEVSILALCDVVEAMSSDRPYRPARPPEAVIEEIQSGTGTKYEVSVAEACLEVLRKGEFSLVSDSRPGSLA